MKSTPIGRIMLGPDARLSIAMVSEDSETDVLVLSEVRMWQSIGSMSIPVSRIDDFIAELRKAQGGTDDIKLVEHNQSTNKGEKRNETGNP